MRVKDWGVGDGSLEVDHFLSARLVFGTSDVSCMLKLFILEYHDQGGLN